MSVLAHRRALRRGLCRPGIPNRVTRAQSFENPFHLHAARAFEQQQVAADQKARQKFCRLLGRPEELRLRLRKAGG